MSNNAMGTVFAVGLGLLFLYIVSEGLKSTPMNPVLNLGVPAQ